MDNVKLTEEDFKRLLEERILNYEKEYEKLGKNEYIGNFIGGELHSLKNLYIDIFGKEALDEFIKRIRND